VILWATIGFILILFFTVGILLSSLLYLPSLYESPKEKMRKERERKEKEKREFEENKELHKLAKAYVYTEYPKEFKDLISRHKFYSIRPRYKVELGFVSELSDPPYNDGGIVKVKEAVFELGDDSEVYTHSQELYQYLEKISNLNPNRMYLWNIYLALNKAWTLRKLIRDITKAEREVFRRDMEEIKAYKEKLKTLDEETRYKIVKDYSILA